MREKTSVFKRVAILLPLPVENLLNFGFGDSKGRHFWKESGCDKQDFTRKKFSEDTTLPS